MANTTKCNPMSETHESIDILTVRLAARLFGIFGSNKPAAIVRFEAKRLIRIHPDIRHWHVWAKERLEDQAVQEYVANFSS